MTKNDKVALAELLLEKERRIRYNQLEHWFPETGPYRAELYPKHLAFMFASKDYIQSCFIAANQVGKTKTGAFAMACHLTGLYPKWWKGKKFHHPIKAWGASKTTAVTRDAIQFCLIGSPEDIGSGMIPKDCIIQVFKKSGSAVDAAEKITVRHVSGGISTIHFKSYDMGREVFQGTSMDVIWLDEEPTDQNIYSECLTRVVATEGIVFLTYTPLFGMSDVVLGFLKDGMMPPGGIGESMPGKFIANATWEDVPHLTTERKNILMATYLPHELEARTKGIPSLGCGAIYPYPESTFVVGPFEIPSHWPRHYGMDVGWNVTSTIFFAEDTNTSSLYIYDEHYLTETKPVIHAEAIKARGAYLPGFIDPSARQSDKASGDKLMDIYLGLGLNISIANNAVEPGIAIVSQYFAAGRLKIFSTCQKLLQELRMYHRNEKEQIVKKYDHAVDAMRYGIVSGVGNGYSPKEYYRDLNEEQEFYGSKETRDSITGY